jgi:hypothetical protein
VDATNPTNATLGNMRNLSNIKLSEEAIKRLLERYTKYTPTSIIMSSTYINIKKLNHITEASVGS